MVSLPTVQGSVADFRMQYNEDVVTACTCCGPLLLLYLEMGKYVPKFVCRYISQGSCWELDSFADDLDDDLRCGCCFCACCEAFAPAVAKSFSDWAFILIPHALSANIPEDKVLPCPLLLSPFVFRWSSKIELSDLVCSLGVELCRFSRYVGFGDNVDVSTFIPDSLSSEPCFS